MSLKSALNLTAKFLRVALVVVLVLSLCAAGADAARRVNAESKVAPKPQSQQLSDTPQVGPQPAPETPGGNMAPSTRPTTEQQAVLSAVTAPGSQNRIEDSVIESTFLSFDFSDHSRSEFSRVAAQTLAEATPRSAALCTLVGAVPSGTM